MSDRFRDKLRNLRRKESAEQRAREVAREQEDRRRREEEARQQEDLRRRQKRIQQELAPLLELVNKEYFDGRGKITLPDYAAFVELTWNHAYGGRCKRLALGLSADNEVHLSAGNS